MATTAAPTVDLREVRGQIASGRTQGYYYFALLGLRSYDPSRLYANIRRGFSYRTFEHLQRNMALSAQGLAELTDIPMRTLARRQKSGKLEPEESDRLARVSRVFGRALELFEGDADAARAWLSAPAQALGGTTPLAFAKTDLGANEVEKLIGRLEYGLPV